MILTLPPPTRIHGRRLRHELAQRFGVADEQVSVIYSPDGVEIEVPGDRSVADIKAVLAAHSGLPLPDEQMRNDAWQALMDFIPAIEAVAGSRDVWQTTPAATREELTRRGLLAVGTLARFLAQRWE